MAYFLFCFDSVHYHLLLEDIMFFATLTKYNKNSFRRKIDSKRLLGLRDIAIYSSQLRGVCG